MERIELIKTIYEKQNRVKQIELEMEKLKSEVNTLNTEIEPLKEELLSTIEDDNQINVDNLVAQRLHRKNVGYTSDNDVLKWLKDNYEGKYVKTTIKEALDKNPLKKALKEDEILKVGLSQFILEGVTDYVVVTDKENYEKMMEHINEGK